MTGAARVAALVLLLALPGAASAMASDEGPWAPRDDEFGVVARGAIGLERRVLMYQWQRDGDGYRTGWTDHVVDSDGFAPGHENPPGIPLRSRRWAPRDITLDGKPVSPEAIEALGRWRVLRPDFSALPGNLSATFQPEGDGLGSAANPMHPEVGDLRVAWRELRMPRTYEGLVLRDGRWELDAAALEASRRAATADARPASAGLGWILLGALAAGMVAAAWMLLRRRRRG